MLIAWVAGAETERTSSKERRMPSVAAVAARNGVLNWSFNVSSAAMVRVGDMAEILAYIDANTWAQWAFALFLFGTPLLLVAASGARGLASLWIIIGWMSLVLVLALLLI